VPRLAVIGHPVAHSRSPAMQNAALAELGLGEWSYEAIDIAPESFEERVRALAAEGLSGANVTVPHKHAALALADAPSEVAREIGAANTLAFCPPPPAVSAPWSWGRGAPPGRWSGHWSGRGRRSRSGTGRRPGPRASAPSWAAPR
jgi:hypothetical protein